MSIFSIFSRKKEAYTDFEIIKLEAGDLNAFKEKFKKSLVCLIIGKRGSGKTALGFRLLENAYATQKRKCYVLGFPEEAMSSLPGWIKRAETFDEIPDGSIVLIDEAGIQFSSRRSMLKKAISLNNALVMARHKRLFFIAIGQNSAIVDVNLLRQADSIFLKQPSLLQKEFERGFLKELYKEKEKYFLKSKIRKESLVYIMDEDLKALASFSLPSFWKEKISTY